jgi:formylglycine-generating enzyme required for sulfatase activity
LGFRPAAVPVQIPSPFSIEARILRGEIPLFEIGSLPDSRLKVAHEVQAKRHQKIRDDMLRAMKYSDPPTGMCEAVNGGLNDVSLDGENSAVARQWVPLTNLLREAWEIDSEIANIGVSDALLKRYTLFSEADGFGAWKEEWWRPIRETIEENLIVHMAGYSPGEVRTLGGIEMVWCPPTGPEGFKMGSPASEADRSDDEMQHTVVLTKGFWLAKTECTQGQWETLMGTDVTQQKAKGDSSGDVTGEGDNYPMYFVSWDDVQDYVTKMSSQNALPSGWKWSLPTEAQWEHACRAGSTTMYAGDLGEMAWYAENSRSKTNPVGTKKPNDWGLHDMHGNVYEWCADWYGGYERGSATDPRGANSGDFRVNRGGAWLSNAQYCRSAFRSNPVPSRRSLSLGFRVALVSSVHVAPMDAINEPKVKEEYTPPKDWVFANEFKMPIVIRPIDIGGNRAGEVRVFGGIEMVWCPPTGPEGFKMGSPEGEDARGDNETQHVVILTKGFWLAKTECTQEQWEVMMGTDVNQQKAKEGSFGEITGMGSNHPMYFVSWEDAKDFLVKMNSQNVLPLGWKWVLPSEAQWEYACRASSETMFAGNLDEMAWYGENSGSKTNPVGTKRANAWGLHDMHGNVWEWCADGYGDYPTGSATDPTGDESGSFRVFRGGSWLYFAADCRSARRGAYEPEYRNDRLGFRPAAVPTGR